MITSTITDCKATAILINLEDVKTYRDKETNQLISVTAFEEQQTAFGEYSEEGFIDYLRRLYRKNGKVLFVGIVAKSFTTDSVKVEMTEEHFLEIAHVIKENESKLGLITRTMKSVKVPYVAIDKNRQFLDLVYTGKDLGKAKIEKAIMAQCKEKGLIYYEMGETTPKEELYGVERSVFAKEGKAIR